MGIRWDLCECWLHTKKTNALKCFNQREYGMFNSLWMDTKRIRISELGDLSRKRLESHKRIELWLQREFVKIWNPIFK